MGVSPAALGGYSFLKRGLSSLLGISEARVGVPGCILFPGRLSPDAGGRGMMSSLLHQDVPPLLLAHGVSQACCTNPSATTAAGGEHWVLALPTRSQSPRGLVSASKYRGTW